MTLLFLLSIYSIIRMGHSASESYSCADPERFIRGGPNLITFFFFFFFYEWRKGQNTTISGPRGPASEKPLKWRFSGVPMMALPQGGGYSDLCIHT